MNEREDAINTVLKALGSSEPSAGFETRMYRALQQAPVAKPAWRLPIALTATVGLLLCALVIGVAVHARHAVHPVAQVNPVTTASPAVVARKRDVEVPKHAATLQAVKVARTVPPLRVEDDAVATHQNIPPPPLPLTQEERMVLRMVRSDGGTQLAQLSNDERANGLRADSDAYHAFFAPRPPLEGQPYYEQHIISGGQQ